MSPSAAGSRARMRLSTPCCRGREDGFAEEDWSRAEREVLGRRGPRSA